MTRRYRRRIAQAGALAEVSCALFTARLPAVIQPGLPELIDLERIVKAGAAHLDARVMCEIESFDQRFPVYAIAMGNPDPDVPVVGFFGGFHGLERIGSHVVIAYLDSLVTRLKWDTMLHRQLESVRLIFMPIVNPGGMWQATRANPNGVDLMRNAPLDCAEGVPFLVGGQRISARMPWYRGPAAGPMEAENQAVCRVVAEELLTRQFSLAVDCHSGFGIHDRVWFPYAHTAKPIEHLSAEIHAADGYLREDASQSSLRFRAAEPSIPGTRRSVGLPLSAGVREAGARVPAAHARTRFLAMDQEESAPALLASRHIQPAGCASSATCHTSPDVMARFPVARGVQSPQLDTDCGGA